MVFAILTASAFYILFEESLEIRRNFLRQCLQYFYLLVAVLTEPCNFYLS